jgi:hypothetical protein
MCLTLDSWRPIVYYHVKPFQITNLLTKSSSCQVYPVCSSYLVLQYIILVPLNRAQHSDHVCSDRQIHFYTLPSLDPVPLHIIKPLRHVVTFAVDHQHLQRPPQTFTGPPGVIDPVDFCVIKRSNISLYNLRERLFFQKVKFPD